MRVQVIKEARTGDEGDWQLCYQWCLYVYNNGTSQNGYRFIWRKEDGRLQPARGQARIPSAKWITDLMGKAAKEKWGDYDGEK